MAAPDRQGLPSDVPVPQGRGARVLRLLFTAPVIAAMAFIPFAIESWVSVYAVHFCRWPATISCSEPGGRWDLIPMWYGGFGVIGVAALLAWAWTGRHATWAWSLAGWMIAFLFVALGLGPREFSLSDLIITGGYTWLGLEFSRRAVLAWTPGMLGDRARLPVNVAALTISVAYLAILATMPSYLAERAA